MSILHRRAAVKARMIEKCGRHAVPLVERTHAVPFERGDRYAYAAAPVDAGQDAAPARPKAQKKKAAKKRTRK